ncbi:hypothetical protein FS842_011445 [Serendipita sp. 407]|nr:hypothetical protein FS842_011445 [Serendipita sp. 407]
MAKKKKTKHVLRPWCWYCERDFEDEKVLMQHQKAKHFKCGHCPRKLNTAGGLAVHIQQVHKLDPEPIENAIQGRNGYDIEIFGMEGIPAADVAAYKRKKEQELSLPPGYFGNKAGEQSKPAPKRNYENRVYTFEELRGMLETHRQLMGREDDNKMDTTADSSGPVLHAAPQNYILPPPMPGMPPQMPGGGMPPLSMTGPPGAPPMPIGLPFPPGMPPFPPGAFPPHGMMPPMPPPGFPGLPPPEALGAIGKPPQMPGVPEAMGHALPPPPPNPGMMPPPPSISKPPSSLASQAPSPNKKPMIGSRTVGSSAAAAVYDPVALAYC